VCLDGEAMSLKLKADFEQMKDEAEFFYHENGTWKKLVCAILR